MIPNKELFKLLTSVLKTYEPLQKQTYDCDYLFKTVCSFVKDNRILICVGWQHNKGSELFMCDLAASITEAIMNATSSKVIATGYIESVKLVKTSYLYKNKVAIKPIDIRNLFDNHEKMVKVLKIHPYHVKAYKPYLPHIIDFKFMEKSEMSHTELDLFLRNIFKNFPEMMSSLKSLNSTSHIFHRQILQILFRALNDHIRVYFFKEYIKLETMDVHIIDAMQLLIMKTYAYLVQLEKELLEQKKEIHLFFMICINDILTCMALYHNFNYKNKAITLTLYFYGDIHVQHISHVFKNVIPDYICQSSEKPLIFTEKRYAIRQLMTPIYENWDSFHNNPPLPFKTRPPLVNYIPHFTLPKTVVKKVKKNKRKKG
jgi:hypothetical protein